MKELLRITNLKKYFSVAGGTLHAVEDVSFALEEGKTLGIVGESGCGKSTLGRTILGLLEPTDGEMVYQGRSLKNLTKRQRFELRKDMQMIFQDPFSSLNPRMSVSEIIGEPFDIYRLCKTKEEKEKKVKEIMATVGLAERMASSYPHELDGGRRQRVGIGRAIALDPKFIVCDEPVSALDVSIQAQILNLMRDLQKEKNLTYIFITHNLLVVRHISDEILVMYMGCMAEKAPSKELFKKPYHPYTKGLLSAIPIPQIGIRREEIIMKGEITSPINPKPGCRFAPRCEYAEEKCFRESPSFEEIEPGHWVACRRCHEINR